MDGIRINGLNPALYTDAGSGTVNNGSQSGAGFSDILQQELKNTDGIKFSKHAAQRLDERDIRIDRTEMQKLGDAVEKANDRGLNNSLVLMGGLAFIVSVKDKTVVTAVPVENGGGNVFTNIDGAVIA